MSNEDNTRGASSLSPDNITLLIEHLLKEKDPATVGLRRILKHKQETGKSFPCHDLAFEEFGQPSDSSRIFNQNERQVLALEKKARELERTIEAERREKERAVDAAREEGRSRGVEDGLKQGYEKAEAESAKRISLMQDKIAGLMDEIAKSKRRIFGNAEHLVLKFACQVAGKVLAVELTQNREIITAVIKKALAYITEREKIIIRVAKEDFETVSGRKDFWTPISERLTDIAIECDERIETGGCVIESNSGVIDARLGVQFAELTELVEKIWQEINLSKTVESPSGMK